MLVRLLGLVLAAVLLAACSSGSSDDPGSAGSARPESTSTVEAESSTDEAVVDGSGGDGASATGGTDSGVIGPGVSVPVVPESPLDAEGCAALAGLLDSPPPWASPGGGGDGGDVEALVAAAPEQAREYVVVLAEARRAVEAELAGRLGSLSGPGEGDLEVLVELELLMSSPEVVEAVAVLEEWSGGC